MRRTKNKARASLLVGVSIKFIRKWFTLFVIQHGLKVNAMFVFIIIIIFIIGLLFIFFSNFTTTHEQSSEAYKSTVVFLCLSGCGRPLPGSRDV